MKEKWLDNKLWDKDEHYDEIDAHFQDHDMKNPEGAGKRVDARVFNNLLRTHLTPPWNEAVDNRVRRKPSRFKNPEQQKIYEGFEELWRKYDAKDDEGSYHPLRDKKGRYYMWMQVPEETVWCIMDEICDTFFTPLAQAYKILKRRVTMARRSKRTTKKKKKKRKKTKKKKKKKKKKKDSSDSDSNSDSDSDSDGDSDSASDSDSDSDSDNNNSDDEGKNQKRKRKKKKLDAELTAFRKWKNRYFNASSRQTKDRGTKRTRDTNDDGDKPEQKKNKKTKVSSNIYSNRHLLLYRLHSKE